MIDDTSDESEVHWKSWEAESSQICFHCFWPNPRNFQGIIHLVAVFSRVALTLPTNAVAAVVAQGGRCVVWPA